MEDIDRSIPFIDTHHHLYELDRFAYDWLRDPGTDGHNAMLGDYRMIRSPIGSPRRLFREFYGANVTKSVHVEADYSGPDPVEETAWLDQVSAEAGFPTAVVVFCDLQKDDAGEVLERHLAASSRVRGVRMRAHPVDPRTETFARAYELLGRLGLSYELNASPGQLLSGRDMAKTCLDTQMILGHAGFPTRRDPEYFAWWRREIAELAEVESVACKVSGLGMVDHDWTVDTFRPYVLHCIDAFGPGRVMFGTNWPVDILFATYIETVDAYRSILREAGFSHDDQERMLCRNAERYYRI